MHGLTTKAIILLGNPVHNSKADSFTHSQGNNEPKQAKELRVLNT